MTAQEWLNRHFPNDGKTFCPMPAYAASVQFFLDVFGSIFETAYNAGKRGQELYDALLTIPGGTRGWKIYFDDWLRRGLFS